MTEKEETKRKMSAIKKKEGPIGEKKRLNLLYMLRRSGRSS